MDNKWIKVILHASPLFAPFLVPILFFLLIQDDEVKSLSIQALLFQIVMAVLLGISGILVFVLIGIPMLIVFGLMTLIVPIIGIVKALKGEKWQYPIVGRWV
ncbi:DUF4870 domain-containing protein [Kurthia sibirica]|uniref:DUF4870 domain-containing protein n=1 Tax=Kurthia sibirica TaxID=202750 RepID=A0A2U3AM99_9BACL|nr:DUF4870 domain-containing protein [Kurthia sibirica]PWI25656.1 DUF4870 domain-containing protein [Kurthia sibirica]GEK35475.1 hypothetical protein KSI01_30080 [Kurthia sibirica]